MNAKRNTVDPVGDKKRRRSLYLGADGRAEPGGKLLYNLLLFGRVCRVLGMAVTPNRMMEVGRALQWIDLGHKGDFYHALRTLMISRLGDLDLFDQAFRLFWRRPPEGWTRLDLRSLGERRQRRKTRFVPAGDGLDAGSSAAEDPSRQATLLLPTYSSCEVLRHKDFAEMTGEEMAMARRMIERVSLSLAQRRSRRYRPGRGRIPEARRALRKNLRHGGEPLDLPRRQPRQKPRPLVLICDVSGSMERYTRILLHFTHTLSSHLRHIESFVFSTRLTRITRSLRRKSVDRAMQDVGSVVKDWGGGTQTGVALHRFNYHWSRRVLAHGAVVLLISDGWDRGDPCLLGREMERLRRRAHRLIWLNPLLGVPQYEPITRGSRAMLPHVDDFLPARNLTNLEALGDKLASIQWRQRGTFEGSQVPKA